MVKVQELFNQRIYTLCSRNVANKQEIGITKTCLCTHFAFCINYTIIYLGVNRTKVEMIVHRPSDSNVIVSDTVHTPTLALVGWYNRPTKANVYKLSYVPYVLNAHLLAYHPANHTSTAVGMNYIGMKVKNSITNVSLSNIHSPKMPHHRLAPSQRVFHLRIYVVASIAVLWDVDFDASISEFVN